MKVPKNLVPTDRQELIGRLYNPFTVRTAIKVANIKWISPNAISITSFLFSLVAAYAILSGRFIIAALALITHHFLDAIDGKVARLRKIGSDYGAWVDKVAGYSGYTIVFIAFIFAFDSQLLQLAGSILLGMYLLSVVMSHGFYSLVAKTKKKVVLVKNKPWYIRIWGVTLLPPVMIITTLFGVPEYTLYIFSIGYVAYTLAMIYFQYKFFKTKKT